MSHYPPPATLFSVSGPAAAAAQVTVQRTLESNDQQPLTKEEASKGAAAEEEPEKDELEHKLISRSLIDFASCPADAKHHKLTISPKVNYLVGMGHKTTEALWFLWFAMIKGYCYCFSPQHFGADVEIYHLLLEPLLPKCPENRTLKVMTVKDLTKMKSSNSAAITATDFNVETDIAFLVPDMGEIWSGAQQKRPPGFGDVLAFVDHFLQDNHLIQDRIYPWYKEKKTIQTAFRKNDNNNNNNDKLLTAAFHLRVGDVVLEAKEEYWRNVLSSLRSIVDLQYGSDYTIQVYWLYFQALFRGGSGDSMRSKLAQNPVGQWPSEDPMLPPSHLFLSKLCREEIPNLECLWKEGTNIFESIDLFVESDIVYASGSSFSQVLTLFQRKERGIKLLALPKELNYWGKAEQGSVPFMQTHTGAFANLRYYYLDGTGAIFPEQLSYLKWKGLT